jgi:hypothetical protein
VQNRRFRPIWISCFPWFDSKRIRTQSLATNLRSLGVNIKVAHESMRHSRCSLDVYIRGVDQQKRKASLKVVELMLPIEVQKLPHPQSFRGGSVGADK